MDDVDYLVEDNTMDDFAYHRKWMGPMVEWHIGGASWEQNANAGNDSGNWGGSSTIESESTVLKSYSINEETKSNSN